MPFRAAVLLVSTKGRDMLSLTLSIFATLKGIASEA